MTLNNTMSLITEQKPIQIITKGTALQRGLSRVVKRPDS